MVAPGRRRDCVLDLMSRSFASTSSGHCASCASQAYGSERSACRDLAPEAARSMVSTTSQTSSTSPSMRPGTSTFWMARTPESSRSMTESGRQRLQWLCRSIPRVCPCPFWLEQVQVAKQKAGAARPRRHESQRRCAYASGGRGLFVSSLLHVSPAVGATLRVKCRAADASLFLSLAALEVLIIFSLSCSVAAGA